MLEDRNALQSFMQLHDDDDAPNGAWQQMLEDAVIRYNEVHSTFYDPYDEFLNYVLSK